MRPASAVVAAILALAVLGADGAERSRRHAWGQCFSPQTGNTEEEFYFFVNTNHASVSGLWQLQVSGATSIVQSEGGAFVGSVPAHCASEGGAEFWYRFGPFRLNAGGHTFTMVDIGGGDGFDKAGPTVEQGEVNECSPNPCNDRSTCKDEPLLNGYQCICNPGYAGPSTDNGTLCELAPWGHYRRPDLTYSAGVWQDSSGNGRDASDVSGGGPTVVGRALRFNRTQGLRFPAGSIPTNFTIVAVARYVASGVSSRVLQAVESDWLLGFFQGNEGVAKFGTWKTSLSAPPSGTPTFAFRTIVAKNADTLPTVFLDNTDVSVVAGGLGGLTLTINKDQSDPSDCEVQEIIIFDGHLLDADMSTAAALVDVDSCAGDPCAENSTCTDRVSPAVGYDCTCKTGWSGNGANSGLNCTDYDACASDPCGATAVCTDLPAPNLGHTCACGPGYTGVAGLDGSGCTDIDACVGHSCPANSSCVDLPAPATNYSCPCDAGYEKHADGVTCIDIDSCASDPCGAHNTCADHPAPAVGYTCTCNASLGYDLSGDGLSCVDANHCTASSCAENQYCHDAAPPSTGFTCTCYEDYVMDLGTGLCRLKQTERTQAYGTCRDAGNGTLGALCGAAQDAPCGTGLFCLQAAGVCERLGSGGSGEHCGDSGNHTACAGSLVCGQTVATFVVGGPEVVHWRCRSAGSGSLNAPCALPEDADCLPGTTCAAKNNHGLPVCRGLGIGTAGALCGAPGDAGCSAPLVCGFSSAETTAAQKRCRSAGAGTEGSLCGAAGDAACANNTLCRVRPGNLSAVCVRVGQGAAGQSCGYDGDAPCAEGLLCPANEGVCRLPGNGSLSSRCGQPGDVFCGSGSVCAHLVDTSGGAPETAAALAPLPACRAVGGGSAGAACGHANDTTCSAGAALACSAPIRCEVDALPDSNGALLQCTANGFSAVCTAACVSGFRGGAATLTCGEFNAWQGNLTCEAEASSSSSGGLFSNIPMLAAAGGGVIVLFVVVMLLVRRQRQRRAAKGGSAAGRGGGTAYPDLRYEEETIHNNRAPAPAPTPSPLRLRKSSRVMPSCERLEVPTAAGTAGGDRPVSIVSEYMDLEGAVSGSSNADGAFSSDDQPAADVRGLPRGVIPLELESEEGVGGEGGDGAGYYEGADGQHWNAGGEQGYGGYDGQGYGGEGYEGGGYEGEGYGGGGYEGEGYEGEGYEGQGYEGEGYEGQGYEGESYEGYEGEGYEGEGYEGYGNPQGGEYLETESY